jgi:hypothetical protein
VPPLKSIPMVETTFATSLASLKMTPSSRLYPSEPPERFSEPTYAVAPSTTIAFAWMSSPDEPLYA